METLFPLSPFSIVTCTSSDYAFYQPSVESAPKSHLCQIVPDQIKSWESTKKRLDGDFQINKSADHVICLLYLFDCWISEF